MKVFITGINGFIASHFAWWLTERGYIVTGTTRFGSERSGVMSWRLGEPIDCVPLTGVDIVIHAAHDFTPGAINDNVNGTLAMERAATASGVPRQILVSSLSARPDAVSEYGRSKLAEEEYFIQCGHTIIRPGTVLGNGGLFGKIKRVVERMPVVPLLDAGRTRMPVIGIHDLCRALETIVQNGEASEYNLFYEEMPRLREIVDVLSIVLDRKVLFVPMPAMFLLVPLGILRYLGIRTSIDVDNLKGYIANMVPYHTSNLSAVLPRPSSLHAALAEAFDGEPAHGPSPALPAG